MATRRRRDAKAPKGPKMVMAGKWSPQRCRYCPEHDEKMTAVKTFGAGMHYECKQGCKLGYNACVLK